MHDQPKVIFTLYSCGDDTLFTKEREELNPGSSPAVRTIIFSPGTRHAASANVSPLSNAIDCLKLS
jgi:hypothetical protein